MPAQVSFTARRCRTCGGQLSRYNPDDLCSACSIEDESAASELVPLQRPAAGATVDDVGVVLRTWRATMGQSQAEVAQRLRMTQQNLSQIENGRHPMSFELRRRAAAELGIPAEDLGISEGHGHAHGGAEAMSSQARWRAERRWLNQHRSELARLAAGLYPTDYRVPDTPLISRPDWLPREPVPLRSLDLTLDERPHPIAVDGSEPETLSLRPLCSAEEHFDRYTSAVKHLDPPRLFESRPSYRLLSASLPTRELGFGLAAYFDKLDVSEALGHELAVACLDKRRGLPSSTEALRGSLPFRDVLGDPFDPGRRAIIPAVTTLTIRLRRYPAEPTFLLHWRDPAKVATAAGVYDVIPAGEFQPASVALWDRRNDFDLWRNIVREFSEELLGTPEHDGSRSRAIDYDTWPLYQELEQAQEHGSVTPFFLGLGLDALTLAATVLTAVVIDDDVFSRIFGGAIEYNDEGVIVGLGVGGAAEGIPFTRAAIQRLLRAEPMASPGAACLAVAWQQRDRLLGI